MNVESSTALVTADHAPGGFAVGERIASRYRVVELLSDGAISAVYRAIDEHHQRTVALKIFDPLRSTDAVSRARFEREFQALRRVEHPGVARVLAFEAGESLDVLVLEFVEGETLKERLTRGPFGLDEALGVAHKLLEAIAAAHRAQVIHRDLKPSNVILHPTRGPVIVDFGSAWFSSALTLTRTGAMIGSPKYMAPELLMRGRADGRADLYGVSALLYEMLAGRPPRDHQTLAELAVDERRLWPRSLVGVRPDLPSALDEVLMNGLSPRPEDRPVTATEMQAALTSGVQMLGRPLEERLLCETCGTALIVSLPICPGCGAATDWALRSGEFAVQLLRIDRVTSVVAWLQHRHASVLQTPRAGLLRRLRQPPIPLVVGVDRATADVLASQARRAGCEVEVVRASRRESRALRTPTAMPREIFAAAGLHMAAVCGVGVLAIAFGAPTWLWLSLPTVFGGLGAWWAARYTRRPLLKVADEARVEAHRVVSTLSDRLAALRTDRARRLAAAAVKRAAPLLLDDGAGLDRARTREALAALDDALEAAGDLDAHEQVLKSTPIEEVKERAEVAAAYDLATARALDACERVTQAISARASILPTLS
ncbi:MAG: serine/threonine-protein kinase [Myxococcota bacterium]